MRGRCLRLGRWRGCKVAQPLTLVTAWLLLIVVGVDRSGVSDAGICLNPKCGKPPIPLKCPVCGLFKSTDSGRCSDCLHKEWKNQEALKRARQDGKCPGCGTPVGEKNREGVTGTEEYLRQDINNRSLGHDICRSYKKWETRCGECGHLLTWTECPRCAAVFFGTLHYTWHTRKSANDRGGYDEITFGAYTCPDCREHDLKNDTSKTEPPGCSFFVVMLGVISTAAFLYLR